MAAESTECPNCKRPCTVGETLWRKATCVNSLCRAKFLVEVSQLNGKTAAADQSPALWQPGNALPPMKAGTVSIDPTEELDDATTDLKKEHRRVRMLATAAAILVALTSTLLFLFITYFPEYGFQNQFSLGKLTSKPAGAVKVDDSILNLLELSYSAINSMNLRPDDESATATIDEWEQSRIDDVGNQAIGEQFADQFNVIGNNLRQSLEYLTVKVNDPVESEEAKLRFSECLRDATKAADVIWKMPGVGDGAKRFEEKSLHFIVVARRIAGVLKGVSVSQPNGLIVQEMKDFTNQLTEEFALVSPPKQYLQISTYNLRTIYDCLLDAMKNYQSVYDIRNNPEKPMNFNNLEASKHAQRFYASLRLGQDLIDTEEQLRREWDHAKALENASSQ